MKLSELQVLISCMIDEHGDVEAMRHDHDGDLVALEAPTIARQFEGDALDEGDLAKAVKHVLDGAALQLMLDELWIGLSEDLRTAWETRAIFDQQISASHLRGRRLIDTWDNLPKIAML